MSYKVPIEMTETPQQGLINFVQMIINRLEDGETREALLTAVDLRTDLLDEVYKVTMDDEPYAPKIDTYGVNKR